VLSFPVFEAVPPRFLSLVSRYLSIEVVPSFELS